MIWRKTTSGQIQSSNNCHACVSHAQHTEYRLIQSVTSTQSSASYSFLHCFQILQTVYVGSSVYSAPHYFTCLLKVLLPRKQTLQLRTLLLNSHAGTRFTFKYTVISMPWGNGKIREMYFPALYTLLHCKTKCPIFPATHEITLSIGILLPSAIVFLLFK